MNRSAAVTALIGSVLGVIAFEAAFGASILDPSRLDWIFYAGIDPSVNFLGWHMFRNEPWTLPLGSTQSLGYPVGTSVALTDSIPILALLFKPATRLLSADFQYMGMWLLCSFALQGLFAALLIRTVTPRLALQGMGAAIFLLAPILIHRVTHPSLTAHWLVLASLWLYFARASGDVARRVGLWAVLVAIAVGTHPYLAAMVFAIAAAAFARVRWRGGRAAASAIVCFASLVVLGWFVAWQTGYFVVADSGDLQGPGLGMLSMNMLAPVMPLHWSTLFGPGPFGLVSAGQHEGYAYLGAGTLLLGVVAIVVQRRNGQRLRAAAYRHLPLIIACGVLTLLALSPTVTAGTRTLFTYDAAWWGPLALFRASGRLFWPVYYTLTFLVVAAAVKQMSHRYACVALGVAALLQAVDVSGAYRDSRSSRRQTEQDGLHAEIWNVAPKHYRHFVLYPTNMCSGPAIDWRPFAVRAGRAGATINAGFAARYDARRLQEYCESFATSFSAGLVQDDELYIVFPRFAPAFLRASRERLACTLVDGHGVCFTSESYARWHHDYDLTRMTLPPDAEFQDFRLALEREYRDRMHREAIRVAGSAEQRLRMLASYLAYRSRACSAEEAARNLLGELAGQKHRPLCEQHAFTPQPLPPHNETMDFRRQMDAALISHMPALSEPTHVDVEGEVVWVQEYAQARLAGQSQADAITTVIGKIRAIAP